LLQIFAKLKILVLASFIFFLFEYFLSLIPFYFLVFIFTILQLFHILKVFFLIKLYFCHIL